MVDSSKIEKCPSVVKGITAKGCRKDSPEARRVTFESASVRSAMDGDRVREGAACEQGEG